MTYLFTLTPFPCNHWDILTKTHKCLFCLWRTQVVFAYVYLMGLEDQSDMPTKNNECGLHRQIEHEFVVVFITYYTFHGIFVGLHLELFYTRM